MSSIVLLALYALVGVVVLIAFATHHCPGSPLDRDRESKMALAAGTAVY